MLSRLLARISAHQPLIEVGISKEALLHNLHTYQAAYPSVQFAPVLKSNAYGHDLGLVARVLDSERIAFFMVDSLYEAKRLRAAGVRSRIVVMGYTRPEDICKGGLPRVDFAITDLTQLRHVASVASRRVSLHLKLDTGMHRQGITKEDLEEALTLLASNPQLDVVGICSHFGDADTAASAHASAQVALWNQMRERVCAMFPHITYKHFAATKGVRFAEETGTNVIRLGIGLYGFDTSPSHTQALMPVLEMRSVIGELRQIEAGESVGYNATYTTTRATTIATIPAGYFEGIDRRLSNIGFVHVRGIACPIVGRVSMNMITVDVTQIPDIAVGESVVLISRTHSDQNSIMSMKQLCSFPTYTESEYVLLAHIPQHLKRVLE